MAAMNRCSLISICAVLNAVRVGSRSTNQRDHNDGVSVGATMDAIPKKEATCSRGTRGSARAGGEGEEGTASVALSECCCLFECAVRCSELCFGSIGTSPLGSLFLSELLDALWIAPTKPSVRFMVLGLAETDEVYR